MKSRKKTGQTLLGIHAFLIYSFLYIPVLVLIVFSFNLEKIAAVWTGFTFHWYQEVFKNSPPLRLMDSFKNSLVVALGSTVLATFLGTLAAFAMARFKFFGKRLFDALLHLPIIIPDIVMGIAMLCFFVLIKFSLGYYSIIIAHTTFNIAFVAVAVRVRLTGFNEDLENAALDLGATPFKTFKHITLPLIMPGVVAGALIAFTLSWDDFLIAFFTVGPQSTTFPVKVYSLWRFGWEPTINAVSTLTPLIAFCLFFIIIRIRTKKQIKEV